MDWMIDWVSMRQQHHDTDVKGKNVCIWLDPETGEVLSSGVGYLSHEGSYSTAVAIRSDGGLVEWSGNPSRWGRADNVFGYDRLSDCVDQVINPHLVELGLPPFTTSPEPDFASRRLQRDGLVRASMITTGAVLTRVDLCRNLSCGDAASAAAYLRAASCAVYRGSQPATYPGSVAWGNARNSRLKIYDKGAEVRDHTKRSSPGAGPAFDVRYNEWVDYIKYRDKLTQWLIKNGVIRQELTLGRQALRSLGLRSWDEWNDQRAKQICDERFNSMKIGCTVGLENSFDAFLDAGFTARQAGVLSGVVSRWYMREPISSSMSRATWYRYKRDIAAVLGIDVSSPPDVAVLNTRVRHVDLVPVAAPDWYRHAA